MSAQDYGAAQPIADAVDKYVVSPAKKIMGMMDKVPAPSVERPAAAQQMNWKPEANAEQKAQMSREQSGPSYSEHSASRKARLSRKYGSADGPK